ncbi:nucleic acid-binding, OB-fold protein [Tanacetum coccineum]
MWDDLAKQFKKDEIEQLPRPIIIAVSSCRVSKYRDVQLDTTSATFYYINPQTKEAVNAYKITGKDPEQADTTYLATTGSDKLQGS